MKRFLLLKGLAISFFTFAQISPNGEINDQVISSWAKANEEVEYHNFIVIPENVSPGYVKVSLTQGDKDLRPAMVISRDLNKGGAIISGSSAQTNNELHRTAYFSVHPGLTYSVKVRPFFNAKQYPVKYNLSWQFFERVDVYEPNDTREEAKLIKLNEEIEAYGISGYIKNYYVASNDPNTYDWYKVVLDSDQVLKVRVLQKPIDLNLVLRLYNDKGGAVGINYSKETGEHDIKSSEILKKGTYYISTHIRMKGPRISNNDTKPIPDHYNTPYKLIVTTHEDNAVSSNSSTATPTNSNLTVIKESPLQDLQGQWKLIKSNNGSYDGMVITIQGTTSKIVSSVEGNYQRRNTKWKNIVKADVNEYAFTDIDDKNAGTFAVIRKKDKDLLEVKIANALAGNVQTWQRVKESNPIPIDTDEIEAPPTALVAQELPCQITGDMTLENTPSEVDYVVKENCVIEVSAHLTINPGVVIKFGKNSGISILGYGRLSAEGTESQFIQFVGEEKFRGYWRGIFVETDSDDNSKISNTDIWHAGGPNEECCISRASIYIKKGSLKLDQTNILLSGGCGIYYEPEGKVYLPENFNTGGGICSEPIKLPCQITKDMTLVDTPAKVDYVVKENCVIDVTANLEIEDGVVVEFEKDAGLGINKNGQLIIIHPSMSKKKEPILRGAKDEQGYWRGIHIETEKGAWFQMMKILNAGSKSVYYGHKKAAVYYKKGTFQLSSITIGKSGGCGVYIDPLSESNYSYGQNTFYENYDGDVCTEPEILSGNLSSVGSRLSKKRGPNEVDYIVKGVYNIGGQLIIDRGVIIEFEKDAGISAVAGGEITIEGTQDKPVVLRGQEALQGYWRGLYLSGDVRHNFQHTKIEHTGSRPVFGGSTISGIHLFDGFLKLENSSISNSAGCGIYVSRKGTLDERNNSFSNNENGAMCNESNN